MTFDFPKSEYVNYGRHRFGWKMVIRHLYHMDTPDTDTHIILDDWFEKTYGWGKTVKREKYDKPFITFMHDPNIPSANFIRECTNFMKAKQREMYKLSHLDVLPKHIDEVYRYLSTIIVFSQHHATNLINKLQIDADVVCIMHPIPNCGAVTHFNPDKYFVNEKRCLFQIGWWLRRLDVFLSLDCNKTILIKDNRTKDGVCALDHITFEISKHKKDRVRENRRRIQNRQQPIIQKLNTQKIIIIFLILKMIFIRKMKVILKIFLKLILFIQNKKKELNVKIAIVN
jgi:hypothetical protein